MVLSTTMETFLNGLLKTEWMQLDGLNKVKKDSLAYYTNLEVTRSILDTYMDDALKRNVENNQSYDEECGDYVHIDNEYIHQEVDMESREAMEEYLIGFGYEDLISNMNGDERELMYDEMVDMLDMVESETGKKMNDLHDLVDNM